MTDERAKELLSEATIEESATPEHIKLATVRGNRSGGLDVNYTLTVPPDVRVELDGQQRDESRFDGLRGHVKAMVANGAVELAGCEAPSMQQPSTGRVSVKMAEITGRVRLESTHGRIRWKCRRTRRPL